MEGVLGELAGRLIPAERLQEGLEVSELGGLEIQGLEHIFSVVVSTGLRIQCVIERQHIAQ